MRNIVPLSLTAGITYERVVALERYPASDGWAMSAMLRGPAIINLTGTVVDGKHKLTASATTTAAWITGLYSYSVRVAKDAEVFEVEHGQTEILPDMNAQATGFDGRTHAERTLDAIEAVIEGRASMDQDRYRINNRELQRTPIPELLTLRDRYRSEVQIEKQRARGGKLFGRAVRVIL